jgi:uncharacterized flavoprotein (TIGR03862 family)
MPDIAVIGAGPAGLIAAETAARAGRSVTVFEAMPSAGRKLLLAGRGGLNLTHSEPLDAFLTRYLPASECLEAAIRTFPPEALRAWAEGLGQETFVGTSGRVFPRAMKASPLLRAWLARLGGLGVEILTRHRWLGWTEDGRLRFATRDEELAVAAAGTILALGGASWPRLGSDGAWVPLLQAAGVEVEPLRPANSGFEIAWSPFFLNRFAGTPLKRIAIEALGHRVRGEAIVTSHGLEGGAVYALSAAVRDELAERPVTIALDLKPDESEETLASRLSRVRSRQSRSNLLRKALRLSPAAIALLNEGRAAPRAPVELARFVKAVPLSVTGLRGLGRAISTAGGVAFSAIDEAFMLHARPGTFIAGEMLDWEAPTGGYLLQASFATGVAAAQGALAYLHAQSQFRSFLE